MGAALRRVYRSDRVFVAAKLPLNDSSHCSMSSFFSSYSAEPPEGSPFKVHVTRTSEAPPQTNKHVG